MASECWQRSTAWGAKDTSQWVTLWLIKQLLSLWAGTISTFSDLSFWKGVGDEAGIGAETGTSHQPRATLRAGPKCVWLNAGGQARTRTSLEEYSQLLVVILRTSFPFSMSSWLSDITSSLASHRLHLALTAVVSGAFAASAVIGLQEAKRRYAVYDLKHSIPDLDLGSPNAVGRVCGLFALPTHVLATLTGGSLD